MKRNGHDYHHSSQGATEGRGEPEMSAELVLNGDDLVSYILPDIYRKVVDNRIDEFISIRNHAKAESLTHFIECALRICVLREVSDFKCLKLERETEHPSFALTIGGWKAHLLGQVVLLWQEDKRLCKPREPWMELETKHEMEIPTAESHTGQRVPFLFLKRKRLDIGGANHLLIQLVFRQHLLCAEAEFCCCGDRDRMVQVSHKQFSCFVLLLAVVLGFLQKHFWVYLAFPELIQLLYR
jgi:hypothetical protein